MSRYLGPIHYWMYNKIQLQDELTGDIADMAERLGWKEMSENNLREKCVREDSHTLDEVIDESNIHGWLQDRIHDAEGRYAVLVTELLKKDPGRIEDMKRAAYAFGKRHASAAESTAFDLYHDLDGVLINGMPCDHINVVTVQADDHFVWKELADLHSGYWEKAGGDPENYRILRAEVIRGVISDAGFSLRLPEEGTCEIIRDAA